MGLFKEIGDWFSDLFKQEVDKSEENKMLNQLANLESIERKKQEEAAKAYIKYQRPEDKEFEYLETYVPIDEETLRETSKNKYSESYNEQKKLAENKYQDRLSKVEKKEEGYLEDAEQKKDYYSNIYADKQDAFKSFASKNGIADSSIQSSKNDDLNKEKDLYINKVLSTLKDKLNGIAVDKEEILKQKEDKFAALDENFSKNVEALFNKLLNEENQKVKDIEKANNKIATEEKEYKALQDKKVKDAIATVKSQYEKLKDDEAKGYYGTDERTKDFEQRYQIAKKSAIKYIENNEALKNLLGGEYYKLLRDIKNG